ncbi:hypothetical protein ABW19_dt0206020 [Dactylella cylindrospora]|nr:hypothetical protein ABW19_dt0206020 [Dactylella cylindrospora]
MFWCLPIEKNWSVHKADACFSYASYEPYFVTTALHILTDFMVLALPFPLLKVLNLTPRKRLEVGGLFALGGLCIICTLVRVIEVGLDANVATVVLWSALEQTTGIIVVCAPALKIIGSPPAPHSQIDLESGNRSIHGQGWWTAGRATPKRRESGGIISDAHPPESFPKTFLRFSNSHQAENAWESLPDKQPSDIQVNVIEQRLSSADASSSAYSDDLKITKPETAAQRPV